MSQDRIARTQLISNLFAELVSRAMTREVLEEVAGPGITPPLLNAMMYIGRHPGCSVRQMAKALSVSVPAGSQLLDRLVRKGLATQTESREDRRISQIELTERGRELVERVRAVQTARMEAVLARMAPERRDGLMAGMEEFISWAVRDAVSIQSLCLHCGTEHTPCCVLNLAHLAHCGDPVEESRVSKAP